MGEKKGEKKNKGKQRKREWKRKNGNARITRGREGREGEW